MGTKWPPIEQVYMARYISEICSQIKPEDRLGAEMVLGSEFPTEAFSMPLNCNFELCVLRSPNLCDGSLRFYKGSCYDAGWPYLFEEVSIR